MFVFIVSVCVWGGRGVFDGGLEEGREIREEKRISVAYLVSFGTDMFVCLFVCSRCLESVNLL